MKGLTCSMKKQTLTEERLAEINQLKSDLQELINLYNQAFTGHQSFKNQNEVTTKLLAKVGKVQQTLLSIRDLNAQVLTQRQTNAQLQKLQQLQMAYSQLQNAMQSMNSLMALGSGADTHSLEIDNTNYSGEIESAFPDANADEDNESKAGDGENFSQPGGHPEVDFQEPKTVNYASDVANSAATADYNRDTVNDLAENMTDSAIASASEVSSSVAKPVDDEDDAEMLAAQHQLVAAKARMAKAKAAKAVKQEGKVAVESDTRNESERADDHEAELQSSAYQKSESQGSDSGMVASNLKHIPVRNADDSETLRAQAEFEKHAKWAKEHPEEIKRRQEKSAAADNGLAIKWPGSKDYLNKQGQVVSTDNLAVQDVTPAQAQSAKEDLTQSNAKDQDEAENALNKELGKLGL